RDGHVTGVQTCALPIYYSRPNSYQRKQQTRAAAFPYRRTGEALRRTARRSGAAFKSINGSSTSRQVSDLPNLPALAGSAPSVEGDFWKSIYVLLGERPYDMCRRTTQWFP